MCINLELTVQYEITNLADLFNVLWSGGLSTLEKVYEHENIELPDIVEELINATFEEAVTTTELNDYFWFSLPSDLKDIYDIDLD